MHTPQLREPRATPTQKHQVTILKESVLDKINKIDLEYQEEWSEEVKDNEDQPPNCLR